jgi:hypothetical protein
MADRESEITVESKLEKKASLRSKITLSLAAFIMSMTITIINAYSSLRGSDIVVVPPKQVILYRDGNGINSVLSFATRFDMINASADHGDVLLEASLRVGTKGPVFAHSAAVKPVFTGRSKEAAGNCALDMRCIALTGLLIVEQPDAMIDLGGGAARTISLSFPAAAWNCKGTAEQCARYGSFEKAITAIGAQPLDLNFIINFNSDGHRRIICRGKTPNADYLGKFGWISLACDQRSISGGPLI